MLQGGVFAKATALLRDALDRTDQILVREGSLLHLQNQALERLSLSCSQAGGVEGQPEPVSCQEQNVERRLFSVLPLRAGDTSSSASRNLSSADAAESSASETPPAALMTLCAVAALRTWSCELQVKQLARCSTASQSLLLLILGSPPLNPQSTAAAAAAVALAAAGRASRCSPPSQKDPLPSRSGSSRQQLQLSVESEAVLSSHALCWHWLLEGALQCLEFCFEEQHFDTLQGAALSLQGIVSSLILIEVLTRRRMQRHAPLSWHETTAVATTAGALARRPLEDSSLLQKSCETLLCCMGRYQGYLYRNKLAVSLWLCLLKVKPAKGCGNEIHSCEWFRGFIATAV